MASEKAVSETLLLTLLRAMSNQINFLPSRPFLYLRLAPECGSATSRRLPVDDFLGTSRPCIVSARTILVLFETALQVVRDTRVQGFVAALQNVYIIHPVMIQEIRRYAWLPATYPLVQASCSE